MESISGWPPSNPAQGRFVFTCAADPHATTDLAGSEVDLDKVTAPNFYRFVFPTLADSHNRYLYAFIELDGRGAVQVGTNSADSYLNGALYQDHRTLEAQMAFRLVYDRGLVLIDLLRAGALAIGLLGIAALLWIAPGWALLLLAGLGQSDEERRHPAEMAGLAAGVSLALYPLLLLWTNKFGWQLGRWYAWLPVSMALVFLLWRSRPWLRLTKRTKAVGHNKPSWESFWFNLVLLLTLALILSVRLLVVRTLDASSWGDSVQHAVMAQLMTDHGGLFNSWQPYAPYQSLTVQYGFSAAVALLSWTTGLAIAQATLLTGQILNGLAILALYPLSLRIAGGNRWAGVGTLLVAGLLMSMPAYYVNWGRYAELAGQVILPVAAWLLWEALSRERISWRILGIAAMALAGMTLNYYRMPFYYAAFVPAWALLWALPHWRRDRRLWGAGLIRLGIVAAVALVLLLPWIRQVSGSTLSAQFEGGVGRSSPLQSVLADYQVWRSIRTYVPLPLCIAALAGLVWALVRRQWDVLLVGLWTAGMALLVAGRLIGLPGARQLQSFAVVIALYIPVGLLVGWLIGDLVRQLSRLAGRVAYPLTACLLIGLALWGAKEQVKIVDRSYVMVTRPDTRGIHMDQRQSSA